MLTSIVYPTPTPLALFTNKTTDGVSPIFTCGDNPVKNRNIILEFYGTIGTGVIYLEQQDILTGIWHTTGDSITTLNFPCTVAQLVLSGNFRLNLSGSDSSTNVTAVMRFDDTDQ